MARTKQTRQPIRRKTSILSQPIRSKGEKYFEVEQIVQHRGEIPNREFKIRWKGFTRFDDTFEPEAHLDGCCFLLDEYISHNGLAKRVVHERLGSTCMARSNPDNWVDFDSILKTLRPFLKVKNFSGIPVEIYSKSIDDNHIYLFNRLNHCYTMYISKEGIRYIADGSNQFIDDPEAREDIEQEFGCLIGVPYIGQLGVDHCGSSSALIALEFIRHARTESTPTALRPQPWLRSKITSLLHKFESANMATQKDNIYKRKILRCTNDDCTWSTLSTNRASLYQHLKACYNKRC